jgi:hydroxymethylbilane synthase
VNVQPGLIRIATRGSPLALAQATDVRRRLMAAHGLPEDAFRIDIYKTSGDRIQDRPLSEAGGKGLFTKEIEEALLARAADIAVHSMKDMPTRLPDGLKVGAVLPREDVRDAFISLRWATLADLPQGARLGTSSLRRRAQAKRLRPDLEVVDFRGNVDTRLGKLEQGVADATFLAAAGLNRLGQSHRVTSLVSTEDMLPAVAQAAVAIEIRADDDRAAHIVAPLDHQSTTLCVTAERAFLTVVDGSCRTPIAANAALDGTTLSMRAELISPDGAEIHVASRSGPASQAIAIGEELGRELLERAGPAFMARLRAGLG